MVFVFLGMQGSGKGTQAKLLSDFFGLEHVNLGEFFRKHISDKTPLGKLAHEYLSKGNLVPDELVCDIIGKMLLKKNNGFVFDGFPRTINQAEYLNFIYPVHKVFYLELDDARARERMMARRICAECKQDYNLLVFTPKTPDRCNICNGRLIKRADDTEELIQNRLDLFHNETQPLTSFYNELGLLSIINADSDIKYIHKQILDFVSIVKNET